jgi:hypothetical protein
VESSKDKSMATQQEYPNFLLETFCMELSLIAHDGINMMGGPSVSSM